MFYYEIVMKRIQATPAQRVTSVCCVFMALPMVDPSETKSTPGPRRDLSDERLVQCLYVFVIVI